MALTIRNVNLIQERDQIIRFLNDNLQEASGSCRFDWLYLENPNGRARVWMAVNDSDPVGMAAAFPRPFRIDGQIRRGWVLGDFCVARRYRSLGPALLLQRVLLESLTKDEDSICYDFPGASMLPIYQRLGIPILGHHVRYVKLLRTNEQVEQYVRQRILARGLGWLANWALEFQQRPTLLPEDIEFSVQDGLFSEEFAKLDCASTCLHPVAGVRSAEYLNWRYTRHPMKKYCVAVAKRRSDLLGYGVMEIEETSSTLVDLYAANAQKTVPGLLAYIECLMREMNMRSINVPVLESCHLIPYLRCAGFHPRESVPVVAHAGNKTKWFPDILQAKNWLLLCGDRES